MATCNQTRQTYYRSEQNICYANYSEKFSITFHDAPIISHALVNAAINDVSR